MLRQEVVRLPERLVHVVERRALEARHEAGGIETCSRIAQPLHHEEPRQRLDAVQVDASALERVLVLELDVGQLHVRLLHDLAGIHDVARVEHGLDLPHDVHTFAELLDQELALAEPDAMLAGARER